MNQKFRLLAVLFAISSALLATYYIWVVPTTLRIAVGPADAEQVRFVAALSKALAEGREPFRLSPVIVGSSAEASRALDAGQSELAVLRSDDASSEDARAIAILHTRAMIIIGHSERVARFEDLKGRRVLCVQGAVDTNRKLVERVFSHFSLAGDDIQFFEGSIEDAGKALAENKADALVLIAPPAGKGVRGLIAGLVKSATPIAFIELPSAEGVAARFSYLQNTTIPAGVFGGAPPKPPEDMSSVAITYELVASKALSDRMVSALTKTVMTQRVRNYPNDGAPFAVQAPPTDEVRRFMVHDGTKALLDDNAQTWLEAYSDLIWLGLFGFSLVGSSVTALLMWLGVGGAPQGHPPSQALPPLLERIAAAQSLAELNALQVEFESLLEASLRDYARETLSDDEVSNRPAWLALVNALIQSRRQSLARTHPGEP